MSDTATSAHDDWVKDALGIDPAQFASGAAASVSGSSGNGQDSDSGGGIWGAIKGAASSVVDTAENVAGDVGHTVADAASGVVNTAENVASDVGHTVADAAGGVVNTVETAASGIVHTVEDAGSGMLNTAEKVAGDVASGNLGQALSDTADGVVTTAGHVASDAAHAVVDTGSAALDAAGKIVTDTQQTVADAATGVIKTAGNVVSDVAHTVSDAAGPDSMIGKAAGAVGNFATTAAGAAVDTVNTVTDFNKGVVEGVVGGVEGLAKGVVTLADGVGKEAYALATDEKAREDALNTVEHGAEAVGRFAETAVTDPSKAASEVGDAVESGATTVAHMAENVYGEYQKAAASGHGAEFIGKGVGQAAVLVAGAVLTDGASVAAEGGAVAAEGAAVLGEGAALAGEGAAVLGEGAAVAGEGAAVLGEGAAAAGEAGALASEGAAAAGEAGAATGGLAAATDEAGTAATRLAERGATEAEDLTAIPGADPGPLPARFQGPSEPVKLFDTELQPIEPGSPNLTATPKPGEPIPYELGDEPPPGQVQVRPGDGSPVADPLAQTQEIPAVAPEAPASAGSSMPVGELSEDEIAADGAGGGQGAGGGEGGGGEPPDGPMSEDAEPRSDIREEFEELQERHGQQQLEVPEEGPDPNFDEPNRMRELDQGPDPVQRDVSLGDVKATQSDIAPAMGDGTPLEDVSANMREEGWDATKPDPQMVQNEDGSLSTLDHRRLSAAEGAELDEVPATVHAPDEPIPEDQAERFQLKKKFTDPATGTEYPKGASPEDWGEAAKFREANQAGELPHAGRTPDIRPNPPKPASAEPSLSERAEAEMRRFEEQDPRARDVLKEFDDAEKAREADLAGGGAEDAAEATGPGQGAPEQPGSGQAEQPRASTTTEEAPAGVDEPGESAATGGEEPAGESNAEEEQEERPRKRERAKDRRARQRAQADADKYGDAPADDPDPDERPDDGPSVGDAKVPLDDALDHADIEMDANEREQFGEWVKQGHKSGGPHIHYDLTNADKLRLQSDVAAFRSERGFGR